ncbi:hypothetical protein Q1695_001189 [Nippostrongylus brasiliensis]|nr:hypothetical protein Q1695_001189 [Nippostrongylus brasiliensis]
MRMSRGWLSPPLAVCCFYPSLLTSHNLRLNLRQLLADFSRESHSLHRLLLTDVDLNLSAAVEKAIYDGSFKERFNFCGVASCRTTG